MFQKGDLIYILDERGRRHWLHLSEGMIKVAGLGVLDGDRMLRLESGDRLDIGGSELLVMEPGIPELIDSLDRGAQIITPKDAETIIFRLSLSCGDTVLEGGAGSGALTIALLNAVGDDGRVISVEMREDFAKKARKNVERAGLSRNWEIRIGDVRDLERDLDVDAVVLDIPDPWLALDSVVGVLRSGGRFCAYVPNANQVENTVRSLRESGFLEVYALENLQRGIEVHEGGVRPSFDMLGHTGYLVFARISKMQPGE